MAADYADRAAGHNGVTVEYEVHYNDYGSRGVVDVVRESHHPGDNTGEIEIVELKSDDAIQQATGANEILRQFNRHRDSFFDGSDYKRRDYYRVGFQLVFNATQFALDHVADNAAMYRSVCHTPEGCSGEACRVSFYHPGIERFAHPFSVHIAEDIVNRQLADEGIDIPDVLYPDNVVQARDRE